MTGFEEWESFYVIIGAAAGALIGLQFVVMTLVAEKPPKNVQQASAAFASPTIVHFSLVLLIAAVLRAPFHSISSLALILGVIGFGGVLYTCNVIRRARRQTTYRPDVEDWIAHVLLPVVGYVALLVAAVFASAHPEEALFGVAGAVLLILFVGIHNAWDAIIWHVAVTRQGKAE